MDLGVQTYTIRGLAKKNLGVALSFLKHRGIRKVELFRIKPNMLNAQIINQHSIHVLALQLTYRKLRKVDKIADFCTLIGCSRVVVSVLPLNYVLREPKAIINFAKKLNRLAENYEKHGIKMGYHHHDFEFKRHRKQTKYEWLVEKTSNQVGFVIDTYWMTKMREPITPWILKLKERLMGIHLRDHTTIKENNKSKDTEIGSGTVDFQTVLNYAKKYQPYLVIEQNSSNPIHSIEKSMHYLRNKIDADFEL